MQIFSLAPYSTRPAKNPKNRGFTLLEVAIVVGIISLIVGMSISTMSRIVETARVTGTNEKIRQIDEALKAYWLVNHRLPCPASLTLASTDVSYGLEAEEENSGCTGTPAANKSFTGATNDLSVVAGAVPTQTLGLAESYMYDGWGMRIHYAVSTKLTATNAAYSFFADTPYQAVRIANYADGASYADYQDATRGAAYVLLSHGANYFGAYNKEASLMTDSGAVAIEGYNASLDITTPYAATTYIGLYVKDESGASGSDDILYATSIGSLKPMDQAAGYIRRNRPTLFFSSSAAPYLYSYTWNGSQYIKDTDYSSLPGGALTGKISVRGDTSTQMTIPNYADGSTGSGQRCYDQARASISSALCQAYYSSGLTDVNDSSYYFYQNSSNTGRTSEVAHALSSSPYVAFTYFTKETPTAGTLTVDTEPTGVANAVAHSMVSGHLAVAHNTSPYVSIYNRTSELELPITKLSNPTTLPTGNAKDVAYSPDGNYLAVAHTTTPFLTIYQTIGTTYSKLPDPATLPNGNAKAVSFSADGKFLAVAHETSPYITVYKIDAGSNSFTKLDDPDPLPSGTANDVDFAEAGNLFAVAISAAGGNPPLMLYDIRHGQTITPATQPNTIAADDTTGHAVEFTDSTNTVTQEIFISNGLVGYWTFDDGAGTTAVDTSGNGNAGTLNGAAWSTNIPVAIGSGNSLIFDGVDDYVITDSPILDIVGEITLSAWINTNSNTTNQAIVVNGRGGDAYYAFTYGYTNNKLGLWQTAGGEAATSDPLSLSGAWHHVTTVRSGSTGNWTITFYVDGINVGSSTVAVNANGTSATQTAIGRFGSYGTGYYFDGKIDDVRIYNRALSAEEVQRIYSGGG